CQQYDDYPYSF
nr:immunoglobulin light chain junction region [Macaca mulatta]